MTCICGIVDGGKVILGADSLGSWDWSCQTRSDEKVFMNGPYAVGYSTSFRMGQLLRYSFAPSVPSDWDVRKHMSTSFINDLRKCFSDGGFLSRDNNGRDNGGLILVGYRNQLFEIGADFQTAVVASGYAAIGSGFSFALGSLYSTIHLPARERLRVALEAAAEFCPTVRAPFHFIETS